MLAKPAKKIEVLLVASESAPFAHVGGLGDIIQGLAGALWKQNISVSLILPKYEQIKSGELVTGKIPVNLGSSTEYIRLYRDTLPKTETKVWLVENKEYLSTGPIYFSRTALSGSLGELQRFVFFSKAVAELLRDGFLGNPDIVHCNDWHTGALIAELSKIKYGRPKTLFTIHNLENQGCWRASDLARWLPNLSDIAPSMKSGEINLMRDAIELADCVNTVSPSYAEEIKTTEYGVGLENTLRARGKTLTGILNGIDYTTYNPKTDQALTARYDQTSAEEKEKNKHALQKKLGLKTGRKHPLFGVVSRLTRQKGIDLILPNLKTMIQRYDAQIVILGTGASEIEEAVKSAERSFRGNVAARIGFDDKLARLIYASCNFFLMPSRFEPCGLGQMIAMRYGTVPIVRSTGGLKDTVQNNRNGLTFDEATPEACGNAIERAEKMFFAENDTYTTLEQQCFAENFSVERAARSYAKLYRLLVKKF